MSLLEDALKTVAQTVATAAAGPVAGLVVKELVGEAVHKLETQEAQKPIEQLKPIAGDAQ